MRGWATLAGLALAAFALAGCKRESPAAQNQQAAAGGTLVVRTAMKQQVNPITMAIWDIGNNAIDDNGQMDAAKLDDAKWASLAEQAGKLGDAARAMAAASTLKAADPADSATGEGEVTMAKVQERLDADPAGFREHASALAAHADNIVAAAKAKDGKKAGDLVSALDGVCESCHVKFWDPGPQ
jgi:cytochrome c556